MTAPPYYRCDHTSFLSQSSRNFSKVWLTLLPYNSMAKPFIFPS